MMWLWAMLVYTIVGTAIGRHTSGYVAWRCAEDREISRHRYSSSYGTVKEQERAPKLRGYDYAWGFATLIVTMIVWPAVVIGFCWLRRGQTFMVTPPQTQETIKRVEREELKRRLQTFGLPSGEDD